MSFDDPEIVQEFVEESLHQLSDVENQLLQIEEQGADIDVELVNTVFRAVHSVKGTAGFLGLEKIQSLAHALETVMNLIRNCEIVPTGDVVGTLLTASDELRELIINVETSNEVDVQRRVDELLGIVVDKTVLWDDPTPTSAAENSDATTEDELADTVAQLASDLEHATELSANQECAVSNEPPSKQDGSVPATEKPSDDRQDVGAGTTASPSSTAPAVASTTVNPSTASASSVNSNSKTDSEKSNSTNKPISRVAQETSIRVPVSTLDQLMNLAGELVLRRNSLIQLTSKRSDSELDSVTAGIDQVTSSLQEAIMQTRMQPINNVFSRFPRVVRDLCVKLGKQCDVEINGKGVEVDKTILEAIVDPLMHIVRNAVDHGIDPIDERAAAGKTRPPVVEISAYHQAGRVCIDVIDNGRGIDPTKIKEKAVVKGVLSGDEADQMSDRDAIRLVFHPGFSTAEQVTDVSGRGVGMDVVRNNIERLGGTVDIESEVGEGTSIRIVLPLTLAIIPSLIVMSAGRRFAIPQINILELVRISPYDQGKRIGKVKNSQVLRLRGELLPLVRLSDALEQPSDPDELDSAAKPTSIVVVETGVCQFGVIVDELRDSEEIVVKPLGQHMKECRSLDGATILGDGQIAWILNVAGLAEKCRMKLAQEEASKLAESVSKRRIDDVRQRIVVFSNNANDRLAVPMDVVVRIDRIRREDVETVGNQSYVRNDEGTLPILELSNAIACNAFEWQSRINVVVFEIGGREVGLLANTIHDITKLPETIDEMTFCQDGVIGSIVENGTPVRLLDIYRITRILEPTWFESRRATQNSRKTILVVEDSDFFRRQVCKTLRQESFTVVEARDGQEAWDLIRSQAHEFSLVITDVEMPNLNGLELCRLIKQSDEFDRLPVIMLTSLGSDKSIQLGVEVGVDEYHVKMNQDQLLSGVRRLLAKSSEQNTESFESHQLVEV
ncbi:MAG: chemotaxis protein CheW [Planctomycetales bacterium]|nr:chemotaxis protein CheW [Planctomycetales bacterium]